MFFFDVYPICQLEVLKKHYTVHYSMNNIIVEIK